MKYFLIITILQGAMTVYSQVEKTKQAPSTEAVQDKNQLRIMELEDSLVSSTDRRKNFDLRFELFGRYLGSEPEKAMLQLDQCEELANQTGDSLLMVKAANARGTVLKNRGELKEALNVYRLALETARRNNYEDQTMYLLNNLAMVHTLMASFDMALKYNLESLRIRESRDDSVSVSVALNNIGNVYDEIGDYNNALRYYERSYQMKVRSGMQYDIEKTLNNIASVYMKLGYFTKAEDNIRAVLRLCSHTTCGSEILAMAYSTLGEVYFKKSKLDSAENCFKKSIALFEKINLSKHVSSNYYWLAKVNVGIGKYDLGLDFLNKSQMVAEKANYVNLILRNYELYVEIFLNEGNFKAAYEMQSLYNELNSNRLNGELVGRIARIETEYKERENLAMISSQSKILALQLEAIEQHQMINFSLVMVVLLVIGLVAVLFKINRQKQQINDILGQRVKERTFELENNRDKLKHAHDEQYIVLKHVSSDLTASLATLKGLIDAMSTDIQPHYKDYLMQVAASAERVLKYVNRYVDSELAT